MGPVELCSLHRFCPNHVSLQRGKNTEFRADGSQLLFNCVIASRGGTCQKYIRPSDCWSGETNLLSLPPAWQKMHDKAEIWPNSKKSLWKLDALLKGAAAIHSHSFSWSLFFSAKHVTNIITRPQGKISNNQKRKDTLNEQILFLCLKSGRSPLFTESTLLKKSA